MALTLILNGHTRSFEELSSPSSLSSLVGTLGLQGDRVAVELNGGIVPRKRWMETHIAEGDRLEVVHFVGGGSPAAIPLD